MKNVAIRPDDRKVLAELSESEGRSMTEILHRALLGYQRLKKARTQNPYAHTKYVRNNPQTYEPSNPSQGSH
jgi:hypothetical protein